MGIIKSAFPMASCLSCFLVITCITLLLDGCQISAPTSLTNLLKKILEQEQEEGSKRASPHTLIKLVCTLSFE